MANLYSQFEKNPVGVKIPRSKISLPFQIKTSFNYSDFVPFYVQEVLPGDTFNLSTSFVARTQTPLVPVMDNSFLDYYYFFVPNRLAWSHWEELQGANKSSPWASNVNWFCPEVSIVNLKTSPVKLYNLFGISSASDTLFNVNSFPILDYYMIWNQWFRDENYQSPLNIYTSASNAFTGPLDTYISGDAFFASSANGRVLKVNRFHDYFTSCLPSPQKGTPAGVSADIGQIPVYAGADGHNVPSEHPLGFHTVGSGHFNIDNPSLGVFGPATGNSGKSAVSSSVSISAMAQDVYPANLYGDGSNTSSFISVNDLRLSFAVQKMLERDARGGTRYNENIFSHFGVTAPDSRLQIPEYLFGTRVPMHINQVVQTAGSATGQVGGATYGQSQTNDFRHNFVKSFTEHGFVIGVMCARTEQTYSQGLEKFWLKKQRLDFYQPELANISEQPVLNKELYNDPAGTHNEEVFGYNEAWADYRFRQNKAVGVFDPASGALKQWTYANDFTTLPTRGGLTEETSVNVARTLAVTNADQVFVDVFVDNEAVRPMPAYSLPGLVDHN